MDAGGGDDTIEGGSGADVIDGGGGFDYLSYENSASGVNVDLALSQASGGDALNDTFSDIEGINGTSSADSLLGDEKENDLQGRSGNDFLDGGSGADTLDGGMGVDTVEYGRSLAGVSVNLLTGAGIGGDADGDRLVSIENVSGSALSDTLTGNAASKYTQRRRWFRCSLRGGS